MKLDLALVALLVSMANALFSIYSGRKRNTTEDELSLTARIARSKDAEAEMEKVAARSCAKAFTEQREPIKGIAREVFRDQMMIAMNEKGNPLSRISEDISELRRSVDSLRAAISNQPEQIREMLIAIRGERP